MSVIRVGSSSKYADGWEQIFGGSAAGGGRLRSAKATAKAKRPGKKVGKKSAKKAAKKTGGKAGTKKAKRPKRS